MTDITFKYSLLNKVARQEVNDFLDFLMQKQKEKRKESLSEYKKKILGVTTWTDSEIEIFRTNQQ